MVTECPAVDLDAEVDRLFDQASPGTESNLRTTLRLA